MHGVVRALGFVSMILLDLGVVAQLETRVSSPVGVRRPSAVLPLDVTLTWTKSRIVRGRFRAAWRDDASQPHEWLGPETAIASGAQTIRVVIAPGPRLRGRDRLELAFVDSSGRAHSIDVSSLKLATPSVRGLCVGVVTAESNDLYAASLSALRVERSLVDVATGAGDVGLTTTVKRVSADRFPDHPLALLGFDLVLFDGAGVERLASAQLDALGRWIEAGGSAAFLFGPVDFESRHFAFLNRVLAGSGLSYAADDRGVVANEADGGRYRLAGRRHAGELAPRFVVLHRSGWGRVAVAHRPPDAAVGPPPGLPRIVEFLWRTEGRRLTDAVLLRHSGSAPFAARLRGAVDVGAQLPDVKPIPTRWIAWLLALYLFAIGPIDWLLTRVVRRGWTTWLLFPLWTTGAIVAVIWLARDHLGRGSIDQTVWIADVSAAGDIVRETGLRTLYSSVDTVFDEEQRDRLVTPIVHREETDTGMFDESPVGDTTSYVGVLPRHYRIRRRLRQWDPTVLRSFEIAPPGTDPIARAIGSVPNAASLRDVYARVQKAAGPRLIQVRRISAGRRLRTPNRTLPPGWAAASRIASNCTSRERSGIFVGFGSIAPTGGPSLDDLVVRTAEDVLLVMVDADDGIRIYRRLEHPGR